MFKVTVAFDGNVLNFTFKQMCDAIQFVSDCIETSESTGTIVSIVEVE